jgi:hypothetical protein
MGQNVFLSTGRHAFRSLDQENKCLQHTRAAFTGFVADYSCPLNTLLTELLTGVNPLAWDFRAREPVVAGGLAPSYEFWGRVGSKLAVCSQPDSCDACPAEAERGGVTSPFVNCTTGAAYLYDYDEDPSPNSGPEPLTCWYLNATGSTNLGTVVQLQPCNARFAGQCLTLSGELDNVQVYNIEKKVYEVQNQRAILRPCSEVQGWQLMDVDFNTAHVLEPFFLANVTPPAAGTVAPAPPTPIAPAPIALAPTPTSPPITIAPAPIALTPTPTSPPINTISPAPIALAPTPTAPNPIQVSSPEPIQVAMSSPSLPPAPESTASPLGAQGVIPAVATTGNPSTSGGSLFRVCPVGFTLLALVYVFG